MRCLQSLLLIVAIGLTGCSGVVFFRACFHPTNTLVTVSGVVSVIQITTITSAGATTTLVTIVTFLQAGPASTINFCGNIGSQFVLNTFTTVDFNQGQPCATIVAISTGWGTAGHDYLLYAAAM
jgi:hypothetical protein